MQFLTQPTHPHFRSGERPFGRPQVFPNRIIFRSEAGHHQRNGQRVRKRLSDPLRPLQAKRILRSCVYTNTCCALVPEARRESRHRSTPSPIPTSSHFAASCLYNFTAQAWFMTPSSRQQMVKCTFITKRTATSRRPRRIRAQRSIQPARDSETRGLSSLEWTETPSTRKVVISGRIDLKQLSFFQIVDLYLPIPNLTLPSLMPNLEE